MASIPEYRNIYRYALDALEEGELKRGTLIEKIIGGFMLSEAELADDSVNGRYNTLKALSGMVINDMEKKGAISREDGVYKKADDRLIAIRVDECEKEILELIKAAPRTRAEIRDALVGFFRTDTTPSVKDDNRLFTYTGQILKKLVGEEAVLWDGSVYSVAPEKQAALKNRAEIISLKAAFLKKLHSRGGEFFEHYFINLISRYLTRSGKTVIESHVTGGSADGGIDGIVRTVDSLGFRETVMIQMKNRVITVTETDVRGFYGAVCAKQGSRGIFATTSDFHPMARKLLDTIDNCVGVDGDKIFSMACDTSYGIVRDGDTLRIDTEII